METTPHKVTVNRVLAILCLGSIALASAACKAAPVGPSPLPNTPLPFAVPSVAGLWRGDFFVDSCINKSYERYACASFNAQRKYVLRLEQSGFEVFGSFSQGSGSLMTFLSDVSGHLEPDGALVLRGSRPAIDYLSDSADVNALTLAFDKAHGLTGTFEYTTYGWAATYAREPIDGSISVKGHIQTAGHQMWDPQPTWTGTWRGFYHVSSCTGGFYPSACGYWQEGVHEFKLTITEVANSISGELLLSTLRVPVTGSSTPSSIRLEGSANQRTSGSSSTVRTFDWNVQRNGVDRLLGRISVTETFTTPSQPMTYEAELVSVERLP
jgi:hypothetical protein